MPFGLLLITHGAMLVMFAVPNVVCVIIVVICILIWILLGFYEFTYFINREVILRYVYKWYMNNNKSSAEVVQTIYVGMEDSPR